MALRDLSRITEVLAETLRQNILQRIDPNLTGLLNVTTLPPERVLGEENTINLYMYHLAEDQQRRNLPGNRSDLAPAATKPMTLVLYYIVTAHHEVQSVFDSLTEQRLMGYALKTFHDFAVIGDDTAIDAPSGPTFLMPEDLRGGDNALEISVRYLEPEAAVSYWSAEQVSTTRLSAYLDVRYAQLAPEPPRRLPGIVLSLGTFVVDIASPQLAGSRSTLVFTLPAVAGGGPQQIEAVPARVGPPVGGQPESNRLVLFGSSLLVGQSRRILLTNPRWRIRAPALPQVPIDATLPGNLPRAWSVDPSGADIALTLDTELDVMLPDGGTTTLPLEPGIYQASVEAVKDSAIQFGRLKQITDRSNAVSFAVLPRIAAVSVLDPVARRIRITLDASVDLTPATGAGLPGELDILVVADGVGYDRHDPADPSASFDPGDFLPSGNQIEVLLRFDPATPGTYPVRVIVEGAESQPFWFEVP